MKKANLHIKLFEQKIIVSLYSISLLECYLVAMIFKEKIL